MARRGLLIFDLDGTLFQVDRVTIPAVQKALQEAGHVPPPAEEVYQFFGRPEPEFREWLQGRYPGIAQETMFAIPAWELRLIPQVGALYPGVLAALTELRELAAHLAICSNGPESYVQLVADTHRLTPLFDLLRWRRPEDDGKSQMVGEVVARFPGQPGIVIGDRGDDIAAAHANGLLAVASCYGFGTPEELAAADARAESPADLPCLLRSLLSAAP